MEIAEAHNLMRMARNLRCRCDPGATQLVQFHVVGSYVMSAESGQEESKDESR
jgi:hypothetical protein